MFKLVFFHKFGMFSSPLFHQYFFYCFQLPYFWYYHIHVGILNALVFLWGSVYFYYFFLFFRLYNFYCFILKSANSSFWQLKSIVESLKWIFFSLTLLFNLRSFTLPFNMICLIFDISCLMEHYHPTIFYSFKHSFLWFFNIFIMATLKFFYMTSGPF